jgi:hypothetical protein
MKRSIGLALVMASVAWAQDQGEQRGPPQQGGRRGPPSEALAACSGASAGQSCSFSHDGHDITGTCRNGPDGNGPIACAPAHGPPGQRR